MKSKVAKKRDKQMKECRDVQEDTSCCREYAYCDCCGCYDYMYCC